MATHDPGEHRPEGRLSQPRQAEVAPQEESRLLAALVDNIPGCVAMVIKTGTREVVASNRAAREIGAVPGETCFVRCGSQDDPCPFCLAPELWATGEGQEVEVEYRGKWYDNVWASLSADLYVHYVFDITERKQTERSLEDEVAERRLLVEQSRDGIVVLDENGKVHEANAAFARMLGYSIEEVHQLHVWDWEAQYSKEQTLEMARTVDDRGDHFETRHRRKDGTWLDVEISTNGIVYGGEKLIFCVCRDVSEQKRAGDLLRLMQYSVDQAAEAVLWVAPSGSFLYANEMECRSLGYSRDELLGLSVFDVSVGVSAATWPQRWEEIKATQGAIFENLRRRKDGSVFPVEIASRIIEYDGEELMFSFVKDITQRKRAEEALKQSEEQLRQSQKMEAVGQLAGGIAHDFNNLLTAILGYSDLILLDGSSTVDEVRLDVEEIKRAGERAKVLTQQILAFSRRQALRPQVVLLDKVICGLAPLLRRTIGENIDLQIIESPGLAPVEVDPHQFEQVVTNLVLNARDAMPSGGSLTVETANAELDAGFCRTHTDALPGSHVVLRVSDTGVGMDAATQERIFEPFFTTKAAGAGTGLGLATVYGIVKQSDGSIFVESEPGRGSSFSLYLPRAAQPEVLDEVPILSQKPAGGPETIMVVEDEEALRSLIGRVLRAAGYQTLIFTSAPEALAAIEHHTSPIDLLLTDVMLPGPIQGHDLARTVLAASPGLPVLYISGYSRDALVHAGRLDDGVNLLEKPFTPKSLTDSVREVLDMSRGRV